MISCSFIFVGLIETGLSIYDHASHCVQNLIVTTIVLSFRCSIANLMGLIIGNYDILFRGMKVSHCTACTK